MRSGNPLTRDPAAAYGLLTVSVVMGFFGRSIGFIHDSGPMGILFSAFVVVITALNLVLDFDLAAGHPDLAVPGDTQAAGEIAEVRR